MFIYIYIINRSIKVEILSVNIIMLLVYKYINI